MTRLVALPPADLVVLQATPLPAPSSQGVRWAILRAVTDAYMNHLPPGHRARGQGFDLAYLQAIANGYDPRIQAAPIKLDHVDRGPAHGYIGRLWLDGDTLVGQPVDVSGEVLSGLDESRYLSLSAEIHPSHPHTGGPYLIGLAVLGAAPPAITALGRPTTEGLRPLTLSSAPQWRLDATQPDPEETPVDPTDSDPTPNPPPAEPAATTPADPPALAPPTPAPPAATPPAPTATPPAPGTTPAGVATGTPAQPTGAPDQPLDLSSATIVIGGRTVALSAVLQGLEEQAGEVRRAARLQTITTKLDALGDRLPLAARRKIEALASAPRTGDGTLRLAATNADGQETTTDVDPLDAVLDALDHLVPIELSGLPSFADTDDPAGLRARDRRDADNRRIDLSMGIDDKAAADVQAKYFTSWEN